MHIIKKSLRSSSHTSPIVLSWSLACQQSRRTAERLASLISNHSMDIDKEVQLNTMYYRMVSRELSELGFIIKAHIEQSDFCLFGKSVPDIYFYKEHGSVVLASRERESTLYKGKGAVGATAQFKYKMRI